MIGCDITKIERFKDLAENSQFLNKYFTSREVEYIASKQNKPQTIAGIYSCKEACLKALQIGIGGEIKLCEVEVLHGESGYPYIACNDKISSYLKKIHASKIYVSISHDHDYAISVCEIN